MQAKRGDACGRSLYFARWLQWLRQKGRTIRHAQSQSHPRRIPLRSALLDPRNAAARSTFTKEPSEAKERMRMAKDGRVHHAEIEIGDSCVMLADENPQVGAHSPEHYGGSPVSLMVYVPDCDAVYSQSLAAGAKSDREPTDQFYERPHGGNHRSVRIQMVFRNPHQRRIQRRAGAAPLRPAVRA